MTVDVFERLVGTDFEVALEDGTTPIVNFRLTEVKRLVTQESARPENYSLVFEGPVEPALGQGTYWLNIDGAGSQPIFFVPVGQTAEHRHYQAIFN